MYAIGYVLMYFLRGSLPWQGIPGPNGKKHYAKIEDRKAMHTPVLSGPGFCEGYPEEFSSYFKYLYTLEFEETPDYDYLRNLFSEVYYILV